MNLEGHDVFVTVGATLNRPEALLPTLQRKWIPVFLRWSEIVGEKGWVSFALRRKRAWTTIRTLVRLPGARVARTPIWRQAGEPRQNEISSAALSSRAP